jgi:cobaltochelatase CobT
MASKPTDGPVEAFRQVTAATMRAMAHEPELQLTFAPEPATMRGNEARLPMPSREVAKEEAAIIRGEADAMSLRLRFHDEALHRKRAPHGAMARQIFNAVEQARCEARGARRMAGTAQNLAAAVEERCRTQGFARVTEREAAPLVEVVGLLAREAFAGQAVPQSARKMVDLWRPWIESKAGSDFSQLSKVVDDQAAFAEMARRLIEDLELGETDASESEAEDDQGQGQQDQDQAQQGTQGDAEQDSADDASSGESREEAGEEGAEGASEATRPSRPSSTRSSMPRRCATPRSWRGCACISTSSSAISRR